MRASVSDQSRRRFMRAAHTLLPPKWRGSARVTPYAGMLRNGGPIWPGTLARHRPESALSLRSHGVSALAGSGLCSTTR